MSPAEDSACTGPNLGEAVHVLREQPSARGGRIGRRTHSRARFRALAWFVSPGADGQRGTQGEDL
jgi:hypothetical protein